MMNPRVVFKPFSLLLFGAVIANAGPGPGDDRPRRVDYLNFAQGVLPIALEGAANALGLGMEQAL